MANRSPPSRSRYGCPADCTGTESRRSSSRTGRSRRDLMTADDRLAELEHRLGILEDTLAIRNLQHAYGYYLDKCLYDEVVDLFAEEGEVIFIGGVYKGKKGAARLYAGRFRNNFAGGKNGPTF